LAFHRRQRPSSSVLAAAADITIVVRQPTGAAPHPATPLSLCGRVADEIDETVTAEFDLHDVVACLRSGSSPRQSLVQRALGERASIAG
jgi:hypothetical protein